VQKEERIVSYTASELRKMIERGETLTDWDRVDNMTEEEIERNALEDYAENGEPDWDGPIWVGGLPGQVPAKLQLTLRIDEDVIDWFKSQGKGYQTRMNAVLRQFMEHEKNRTT
jgi:uncharacterized protein (DUF4415 family)